MKKRGDLINAYEYLKGRSQVDGAMLISAVCSNRIRGNGNKLEHRSSIQAGEKILYFEGHTALD